MGQYRITRNIEASIIEYLRTIFSQSGGWSNITIEKNFSRVYGLPMDENKGYAAICVRVTDSKPTRVELGTNVIWRTALVEIDVFATSDGQRLDLKDALIAALMPGVPYNTYTVSGANVTGRTPSGRLTFLTIDDKIVNLGTDKSLLDVHDRYRHNLSCDVSTGQAEA